MNMKKRLTRGNGVAERIISEEEEDKEWMKKSAALTPKHQLQPV